MTPKVVLIILLIAAPTLGAEAPAPDRRAGSLNKDEPQPVYAADINDSWNRIFYCLFTRTITTRLSGDFEEGKPFDAAAVMGLPRLLVSRRSFERIESGDRAIEPLYPAFFSDRPLRAMTEPRFSLFKKALEDALAEKAPRSALARALMQSDVWAAYDLLYRFEGHQGDERLERRKQLMPLLARFVKKLALTEDEIKALPGNYGRDAVAAHRLPDLFGVENGWMEIRWFNERTHDRSADFRRVSRVFVKPAALPKDKIAFLNGLRQAENVTKQLDAAAVLMQNLHIDRKGKVVPSPLTYEVQIRTFVKDGEGKFVRTEGKQFELSRRLLLSEPKTGGFLALDEQAPAYLPSAGNDYTFASEKHNPQIPEPILARLKTRCAACHSERQLMTFGVFPPEPLPPVSVLKPSDNEHAQYVIGKKRERKDFKALQERWKAD